MPAFSPLFHCELSNPARFARQDVDTQAALVKQIEGVMMTDRAAEGVARLNLGHTQVKAAITGRVGLRVVDMGNLVGSGDANGIAVITQLSPLLRRQAADAANQVEVQILNRYQAGQVSYTEVVQAQSTALSARRALVQAEADRQTTAVADPGAGGRLAYG